MDETKIIIPAFLSSNKSNPAENTPQLFCDFCSEVACETDAMTCGQCSGQSCTGQCTVSEGCSQGCSQGCSESVPVYTPPSFSIVEIGSNSVKINATPGSNYPRTRIFIRLTSGTNSVYDSVVVGTSSFTHTISTLQPEMSYTINVGGCLSGDLVEEWAGAQTFTTASALPIIELWSWNASYDRKLAHTALLNKGKLSDFSYIVWNDLVDKINEVVLAIGDTWNTVGGYLSIAETRMTYSDKNITAARFNSMKHNVGRHFSTGIQDVLSGSVIYGSYFTTVADKLNSWIRTIR